LRHASALEGLIGQFSKLCELNYWNGTVLNVAHGMIPVCLEFMHVLLQRPVRMDSIMAIIMHKAIPLIRELKCYSYQDAKLHEVHTQSRLTVATKRRACESPRITVGSSQTVLSSYSVLARQPCQRQREGFLNPGIEF
jgi:hypothetical protein